MTPLPRYTLREEIASSITHGVGAVLAIAGLAVLVAFAARFGDAWHVVSCSIFGAALILCFTTSTLYHSVQVERVKRLLRALDHTAIFLLIAGTYTPFTLVTLRGPWGYALFAIVWTLAALGIALELKRVRNRLVMVALYLAMGWVGIIAIGPLLEKLPAGGLWLLFGGGVCYTLGVPFYLWRRLPYNHALWHVFVLAGSVLQFLAVLLYVMPD